MREIKFRIWDKEQNKYLNPCFESEEDRFNKDTAMIHWNSKGKLWFTLSGYRDEDNNLYQIDEELEQFTGLHDKNGVEIYENDKVKVVYDGEEYVYQVVFDISELDFKATNGEENYGNNFQYLTCCEEIEVIGNIHERSE